VAVVPTGRSQADIAVDAGVVVDVDLAVEICVTAVGVHHQRIAAGDGLPGPDGGLGGGDSFDLRGGGDADAGKAAGGGQCLRRHDAAAAVPASRSAAGLNQSGD